MTSEPLHMLFVQIVVTCFSLEPNSSGLVFPVFFKADEDVSLLVLCNGLVSSERPADPQGYVCLRMPSL